MNSRIYFKRDSNLAGPNFQQGIKTALLVALMLFLLTASLLAQQAQYTRPSWFFGAAAGANVNFFRGSTQQLNPNFTPPVTFHDGIGVGLYLAPVMEYHAPGTGLGFMLQAGYDSRRGDFDQQLTDCNCPADLSTNLGYVSIEPSLRWAPGASHFYLFGGPRFAFNVAKSFTYSLGINPAYPEQELTPDVKGDISEINNTIVSMQLGAGYDIYLSSQNRQTQFVLSPFVAYHPYFGQDPRSVETWNINTLRIGAALKLGRGRLIPAPVEVIL
ncbi:MAG TPA: outer membrane beta-barrel protein, partial [Saprospiraceae bacterium]|nr:outer membrane beta-barrel protein [Saprospiraceae bacterium]